MLVMESKLDFGVQVTALGEGLGESMTETSEGLCTPDSCGVVRHAMQVKVNNAWQLTQVIPVGCPDMMFS